MERVAARGPVCVGLDPVWDRLPEAAKGVGATDSPRSFAASASGALEVAALERFCVGVCEAVADVAACVKPQAACFERYGAAGFAALERVCAAARALDLPVVLDAKRGDIGVSAAHYAAGLLGPLGDALTVNPYLGGDSLQPFVAAATATGTGLFVLVRTSNPDSGAIQSRSLAEGGVVGDAMAELARSLGESSVGAHGMSDVGAVVGLTKANEAAHLRVLMPRQIFLVPGYGAQGGSAAELTPLLMQDSTPGRGVLVNASRSVIYAEDITDAADRMRDDLANTLRS